MRHRGCIIAGALLGMAGLLSSCSEISSATPVKAVEAGPCSIVHYIVVMGGSKTHLELRANATPTDIVETIKSAPREEGITLYPIGGGTYVLNEPAGVVAVEDCPARGR